MFRQKSALKAGLAGLAIAGAVAGWSASATAGQTTGTWRNGMVAGPYGPGYYGRDGTFYGNGFRGPRRHYGYRGASLYEESACYTVRRRMVDDWGRVIVRRTRVCD
jgi:hypothetical protein